MKANPKNALMIVAALLALYVGAYFATMKVMAIHMDYIDGNNTSRGNFADADIRPRWARPFFEGDSRGTKVLLFVFTPLIMAEKRLRPPEYWEWKTGQPKRDWVRKEW